MVDHRGERRRPTGARETGDEHEPRAHAREVRGHGRQAERVERRHTRDDAAEHQPDPAALAERAHPEPAEALDRVDAVHLGAAVETDRGVPEQVVDGLLGVPGLQDVERRFVQRPVDPQPGTDPDLQVDVGRPLLHGEAQQAIEIQHVRGIGR